MNVHVHVEWLQECYEYGTNYRTLDPLFFICPALRGVCVWSLAWVSFHFQQSCDELVWVTIVSKAAIFLALCLHSAVDELLRLRSNKPIRKPSEHVSKGRTQRRKASLMRDCVICSLPILITSPSMLS